MITYVIDSNILIDLHRTQPRDISVYDVLWRNLEFGIRDGKILISDEVHFELTRGSDALCEWIKRMRSKYPAAFISSNSRVQIEVAKIMSACPSLVDPDSDKNHADPFVIAVASLSNGVVVSSESPRKQADQRFKVPDACTNFNVRCIKYLEFAGNFHGCLSSTQTPFWPSDKILTYVLLIHCPSNG